MASECAENFGAYSACSFSRAGLVSALVRLKKTDAARDSVRPDFSSATIVVSKVGLALLLAIA